MKKKTNVKRHVRRTKKGRVIVRKHKRFTKTRKTEPYNLTAAEKFGKENLKNLPKVSFGGRDRNVFALDDDKVLKIAKNKEGLLQNEAERGLNDYFLPEKIKLDVFETGKDYVVAEKADTSKPAMKKVREYLKPLKEFSQLDFDRKTSELQDAMTKLELEDYMNYDLAFNDFKAPRNWGVIRGHPSLVDGGALNKDSIKGNRWPINEQNVKEWEEVKQKRRSR